jgi:HEPN domain-containing protein
VIKVGKLEDAFPGGHYASPAVRASMLAYAGREYLSVCVFLRHHHEQMGPLFNFMLPTMHQTLELLAKAVVFKIDTSFNPKKYSHRLLNLLKDYSGSAPFFASLLEDPKVLELVQGLEKSYLGVRYGECTQQYDGDDWLLFVTTAEALLEELANLTGLEALRKR